MNVNENVQINLNDYGFQNQFFTTKLFGILSIT